MASYLVLDTNALPIKGNLGSAFWAAVFRLCTAKDIRPAISEVTLHEAVNLRRDTVASLVETYGNAHRKLSGLTSMPPAFLPSPEDVAASFQSSLTARFTVLPLDGEHARTAFEREARRIPPAHGGAGGRDTAIWLTAVALLTAGHDVHFVTNNTSDFGKDGLAESMKVEVDSLAGSLSYYHSVNSFVDAIATKVEAPALDWPAVAKIFEDSIRSIVSILLTDDEGGEDPQDRVLDSHLELTEVNWIGTYVVDGGGLAMVKARFKLADDQGRPEWATGYFEAWFEYDPETLAVEPTDVDKLAVDSR